MEQGPKSQATSTVCSGGVSAIIGSSDLDEHTLGSGGASGNQLSCSLPFEAEQPIVEPAWQAQPQVCDHGAGSSRIYLQRSPVIRTDDTITGFLGSKCLHAELHTDSWTVSGSEGFRRFFSGETIDQMTGSKLVSPPLSGSGRPGALPS